MMQDTKLEVWSKEACEWILHSTHLDCGETARIEMEKLMKDGFTVKRTTTFRGPG